MYLVTPLCKKTGNIVPSILVKAADHKSAIDMASNKSELSKYKRWSFSTIVKKLNN